VTLSIDAAHPGIAVSPMLYGVFFEDVNRAGDGGLYAEMVQNRSFERCLQEAIIRRIIQRFPGADLRKASLARNQFENQRTREGPSFPGAVVVSGTMMRLSRREDRWLRVFS
jgi:hypothetical protein